MSTPTISEDAPAPRPGEYDADLPNNPSEQPGLEIRAIDESRLFLNGGEYKTEKNFQPYFIPDYYPDRFNQTKERKLERDGRQCEGEHITVDKVKNREIHLSGVLLEYEIGSFNRLVEYNGDVEIISPLVPRGAMTCVVKKGEIGNEQGYDPHANQRLYEYMIDLVSTGADEYEDDSRNPIVSSVQDRGEAGGSLFPDDEDSS